MDGHYGIVYAFHDALHDNIIMIEIGLLKVPTVIFTIPSIFFVDSKNFQMFQSLILGFL